jgi:hypothetical protein
MEICGFLYMFLVVLCVLFDFLPYVVFVLSFWMSLELFRRTSQPNFESRQQRCTIPTTDTSIIDHVSQQPRFLRCFQIHCYKHVPPYEATPRPTAASDDCPGT